MLQINHRESLRDIDIFLDDPQLLGFLDPRTHNFEFEIQPTDYQGDGAGSLKLVLEKLGKLISSWRAQKRPRPQYRTLLRASLFLLETIPEIITKKIYHRGASIVPRDIFDIAAGADQHEDSIIKELRNYRDEVTRTLATLDRLNADYVNGAIADLAIKEEYKTIAKTAFERSREDSSYRKRYFRVWGAGDRGSQIYEEFHELRFFGYAYQEEHRCSYRTPQCAGR